MLFQWMERHELKLKGPAAENLKIGSDILHDSDALVT